MKRTIKTIILFFVLLIGVGTDVVSAQPPAHAKAHGVKKKYRYYPNCNVYFDPGAKRYTYFSGGRWTTTINLPNTIRLVGSFNDFDFDGNDPWKENSKHKTQYKPSKEVKSNEVKKSDINHVTKSKSGGGKKK